MHVCVDEGTRDFLQGKSSHNRILSADETRSFQSPFLACFFVPFSAKKSSSAYQQPRVIVLIFFSFTVFGRGLNRNCTQTQLFLYQKVLIAYFPFVDVPASIFVDFPSSFTKKDSTMIQTDPNWIMTEILCSSFR